MPRLCPGTRYQRWGVTKCQSHLQVSSVLGARPSWSLFQAGGTPALPEEGHMSESRCRLSFALLLVFIQLTLRREGLAAFVALLLISLWHNLHLLSDGWCAGVVF